eukprot:166305-Pelagomonas_calceolata.AAC.1
MRVAPESKQVHTHTHPRLPAQHAPRAGGLCPRLPARGRCVPGHTYTHARTCSPLRMAPESKSEAVWVCWASGSVRPQGTK